MHEKDVLEYFVRAVQKDRNYSEALCAVEALVEFIKDNRNSTLSGLLADLQPVIKSLETADINIRSSSISSACNMFLEYITYSDELHQNLDFESCKVFLLERAKTFLEMKRDAMNKIAILGKGLPFEGKKILIHSYSRVVLHLLKKLKDIITTVYVTESRPDFSGKRMFEELVKEGIDAVLVLDSAVGYVIEKVDLVLLGAETVCQSGGALNKIGSYTIALCAKALYRPVYVAVESFKFAALFPLGNKFLPSEYLFRTLRMNPDADTKHEHPEVDLMPPSLITYFVTDLGVFTPEGIIKLLIDIQI